MYDNTNPTALEFEFNVYAKYTHSNAVPPTNKAVIISNVNANHREIASNINDIVNLHQSSPILFLTSYLFY